MMPEPGDSMACVQRLFGTGPFSHSVDDSLCAPQTTVFIPQPSSVPWFPGQAARDRSRKCMEVRRGVLTPDTQWGHELHLARTEVLADPPGVAHVRTPRGTMPPPSGPIGKGAGPRLRSRSGKAGE